MSTSNIKQRELKKFLRENEFVDKTQKGHNKYIHKPSKKTLTINFHRSKGKEVGEDDLRNIARILDTDKPILVRRIKNDIRK